MALRVDSLQRSDVSGVGGEAEVQAQARTSANDPNDVQTRLLAALCRGVSLQCCDHGHPAGKSLDRYAAETRFLHPVCAIGAGKIEAPRSH
jgi:hypothetical protein